MRAIFLSCILLLCQPLFAASNPKLPVTNIVLPDGFTVKAETASTPRQQELGLQFRTALGPNEGMLFTGEAESWRLFWMLNTLIPLDMVFIHSDKTVSVVHGSVPATDISGSTQNPARRGGMAQYVLELPAGAAAAHGLKQGDLLKFTLPNEAGKTVKISTASPAGKTGREMK